MDLSHSYCMVAVCLAFTVPSNGNVLPDLFNGAVGQSVMFRTNQSPTQSEFFSVAWKFKMDNIITSTTTDIINPEYSFRINLNKKTGSLELLNLTLDDSGPYTVFLIPLLGLHLNGDCNLQVYEPVSSVTVTPNTTELLEFSSSVSMSCNVSTGTSLSYLWMNGSSEITVSSVGVQISDGNTTLTVLNVTRYDRGPYQCRVFNPVSSETSDPLTLHPSYGPVNIQIEGPAELVTGQMLKLLCRAESTPPADFTWMNGTQIIGYGAEFSKTANLSDNGEFTCQAENNVTKLFVRAVHRLSVTESSTHQMSSGAIAGIATAVIIVVVVVGALMYHVYANRTAKKKSKFNVSKRGASNGGYVKDSALSTQEMNYADISHLKKNNDVGMKRQNPDTSSTIYSETKRPAT